MSGYRTGSVKRPLLGTYLVSVLLILCAIICICGCGDGGRDVSTPRSALLGQWKPVSSGRAYIFFSPDTVTYLPAESGESIALGYEIVEEDVDEFQITIRFVSPTGQEDEAGDHTSGLWPSSASFQSRARACAAPPLALDSTET